MGNALVGVVGDDDVTPWEALLLEVRRSAYRVRWVDHELDEAVKHEATVVAQTTELDPGPLKQARDDVKRWLRESRMERRHLTVVSKAAIDAGVAKVMVEQAQLDGQVLARIWARALGVLGLTEDQQRNAGKALRLALETELAERQEKTAERRRAEEAERAAQLDLDAETIEGELAGPEDGPEARSGEERPHPSNPGAFLGDDWAGGLGDGRPAEDGQPDGDEAGDDPR